MDCLSDIAPSEEDLIAFALDDQPLPAEAQEHLASCERCQQRLAELRSVNASLVSRLYRSQCPDALSLSYYSAGGLSDERRVAIANHLLDCPLCMAEVEEARHYLQEQPIDIPALSFRPHALVRRIFATRVAKPQLQFVLRSDAQETTWPRLYKAESVDLSLHLSRTSSGEHMLLGILTSVDPSEDVEALEGVEAELYNAPLNITSNGHGPRKTPFLRTQVDDMGNIAFKPVPSGEYVMILHLPGREVIIEGLLVE
jgi:hypothetical protein